MREGVDHAASQTPILFDTQDRKKTKNHGAEHLHSFTLSGHCAQVEVLIGIILLLFLGVGLQASIIKRYFIASPVPPTAPRSR